MIAHKWQPIQPIDAASEQYDFSEIVSLQLQWKNIRDQHDGATSQSHLAFLERLGRSWAIETGIIEGLYTLDRGVTETLIERGIAADFIERGDTNRDPQDLVIVLRDQKEAIDFVYQYIRDGHPLTISFIRQLHQTLTDHQDTYSAIDQFGNRFGATLDKGGFKKLPNNPTRQDGSLHEYCPPEQVDSEIQNLLYFYNEMQKDPVSYHPLLTGAWLHHAFTQIHPFEDGNGRVVRALLTWHLVKEGYLPIVISRDDREKYIETLELADGGALNPFIDLIVQLEKRTILQALGEPGKVTQSGVVDQVLDHIIEQLERRNQNRASQLRSVNNIAQQLQEKVSTHLSTRAEDIGSRLMQAGMSVQPFLITGGPGNREHWYWGEVTDIAKNARHWANPNESRYFVRLALDNDLRDSDAVRHPRLVFVVSLHHVGRELSGIMAATSFARIEHYPDSDSGELRLPEGAYFKDCTVNPFTFTWESNTELVVPGLIRWVEERLGVALSYWREFFS
ncbi:MAG: Fic family protein [Chloroflexi bacterium]|nr:Fic family protein [Chloroflexota bacterium]